MTWSEFRETAQASDNMVRPCCFCRINLVSSCKYGLECSNSGDLSNVFFWLENCLGVDMSGMGKMIRKYPVCSV